MVEDGMFFYMKPGGYIIEARRLLEERDGEDEGGEERMTKTRWSWTTL